MQAEGSPRLAILVVDDNRVAADSIARLLGRENHKVEAVYDGQTAIERLRQQPFDLVFTDLRMEPVDGMAVVQAARAADPPVDVIVFTAYGSVETAVEAMRLGALDFLTKPVTAEQLLHRVRQLRRVPVDTMISIVGESEATRQEREQAQSLAQVRSTVLIAGETGTGRAHLARWLHYHGLDRDRPMLIARPNLLPRDEALLEAGTLLIPGIDDWSADAQAALQRQLETLEAGRPPRVIATSSPDIDLKVAQGHFRPELYFRLAVLMVRLVPLRERPGDLEPLLRHFLQMNAQVFHKASPAPAPDQLAVLATHGWPGNVREVANLAERAVVLGTSAYDMTVKPFTGGGHTLPTITDGFNLPEHLEGIERTLLVRAIEQTGGDRPTMSRLLGLERNTLRYKLNKYNLLDRT